MQVWIFAEQYWLEGTYTESPWLFKYFNVIRKHCGRRHSSAKSSERLSTPWTPSFVPSITHPWRLSPAPADYHAGHERTTLFFHQLESRDRSPLPQHHSLERPPGGSSGGGLEQVSWLHRSGQQIPQMGIYGYQYNWKSVLDICMCVRYGQLRRYAAMLLVPPMNSVRRRLMRILIISGDPYRGSMHAKTRQPMVFICWLL